MKRALLFVLLAALAFAVDDTTMKKVIESGGPGFAAAMQQDPSEALCSEFPQGLPADRVGGFVETERAKVSYAEPLAGDWERGREVFVTPARGNCYACHAGEPSEAAFGDVGPPLTNYGLRGQGEGIVKYTYEKIYNAWITVPCSTMPRYGVNGRLTAQEIADLVAYLTSPDSPINPAVKGGK
ncbi:sulfur oxidation c-type cytochrome SoxX [Oceanithermus desulfurans]